MKKLIVAFILALGIGGFSVTYIACSPTSNTNNNTNSNTNTNTATDGGTNSNTNTATDGGTTD